MHDGSHYHGANAHNECLSVCVRETSEQRLIDV